MRTLLHGLNKLSLRANHSYIEHLIADPEHRVFAPNKRAREVKSGHYVPVRPDPLPRPYLVSFSQDMATELGLSPEDCTQDPRFPVFFSGHMDAIENSDGQTAFQSWATGYALSIYGQDMYHNCPFRTGNGYGDGRAISIGEVLLPNDNRWEMQLKGAGTTPYCRGGDGRAVLRSSVREYLASEAMLHLGVPTTRALSLITTNHLPIHRPWFSNNQQTGYQREPDIMKKNKAAITCRVSPSFLRIGQIQLFERRVRNNKDPQELENRIHELSLIVEHCIFREYQHINKSSTITEKYSKIILTQESSIEEMKVFLVSRGISFDDCSEKNDFWKKVEMFNSENRVINMPGHVLYGPLQPRILEMMREASQRIANLMADWLRVGYCQGNFNSDNCLVGGRTMDYGPFGFMEKYDPMWCMWTGGGEHYSYANQPNAGLKNFISFCSAVAVLLDEAGRNELNQIMKNHAKLTNTAVGQMWSTKLGIGTYTESYDQLHENMHNLMEESLVDFTIFFRLLANFVEIIESVESLTDSQLLLPLQEAFFIFPLDEQIVQRWGQWIRQWFSLLDHEDRGKQFLGEKMKKVSPKYIPREWMLIMAYEAAENGDFSVVKELENVFREPYSEGTKEMEEKYFRKAQLASVEGEGLAGQCFMTCSS